ncbi:hypothetical protein AUK22_10715 [bacterium CG2_30_54_10]|nr:MAG: hypothetical protein AUK22_10715 [bacterium CG2_30_54_10]
MSRHNPTVLLLILFLLLCPVQGRSCSLAQHDWKPIWAASFPLGAPLVLTAELDRLRDENVFKHSTGILWILDRPESAILPFLFHERTNTQTAIPRLHFLPNPAPMLELARSFFKPKPVPLLLKTDQNLLRLALFLDRNSRGTCFQIVAIQEGRCRAILPASDLPFALEFRSQAWISIVFFAVPFPGSIISVSAFPIEGKPEVLWNDPSLVENLVAAGTLTKRSVISEQPKAEDIPPFPKDTK